MEQNPFGDLHGSARWMTHEDAIKAGLYKPGGVVLGQNLKGELFRFDDDGHVMVFAPTGAGKGIGFVQANLIDYHGSMVVLDPKGENAIVSAAYRRSLGQEVIILDPFNKTGMASMAYNPLGGLTFANDESLGPTVQALAGALMPVTEHETNPHWPMGARKFASFLMWYMIAHEPPENRHLINLFELAHKGRGGLETIARIMAEGHHPDQNIRRMCVSLGNWFFGREDKEFSYFESQIQNNIDWVGDLVWSKVLASPPSQPLPLKRKKMTIYLVLPFNQIDRYRPWLRIMVADLIASLYDAPGALKTPVLFMLDEAFAGLGHMESLFAAAAAVRSAGARLCFIYQDILQVEKLYGKSWASLIANSGVTLFWAVNDLEAAGYISKFAGNKTAPVLGRMDGMEQPLIRPEQVFQLPKDEIVALFRSAPPAKFGRLNVLTDDRFRIHLAKNTTYNEPIAPEETKSSAQRAWVPIGRNSGEARPAGKTAAEMEADLLAMLSTRYKHPVFKHPDGRLGYLDDNDAFVKVG